MKDDSIYRLLQDLPRFVGKETAPVTEKNLPPDPPPAPDDMDLFAEAMKGVRKLDRGKPRVESVPVLEEPSPPGVSDPDRKLLERTLHKEYRFNTVNMPEYMEGYSQGINPLTMQKLRNGEFSVQRVLDLHGCRAEEAEELFEEFLKEAIRSNLHCVKVIHGRGLKSRAGPVLKEKLKQWIMRAIHRKWITGFSSAPMGEGGPGATNILLKKQPAKKVFRIVG